MEGGPWYATREMVKGASDVKETARLDDAIDRNLERNAREAELLLGWLHFYPVQATRYFDWPDRQLTDPWNLWLGDNPLYSLSAATSGEDALTVNTDLFLEPANRGAPYSLVRINSASSASWSPGISSSQRALSLTGLWAHGNRTSIEATLSAAVADAVTGTFDVSDSSGIGVGDLVQVDTERCVVIGRTERDTGVNTTGALANERGARALSVPDGTAFHAGEVITVDVESMRVDRVLGNTLAVTRAWDGSTLAAHNTNSDIYAPRRLAVRRGFGGTTAVGHDLGASVLRWVPPLSLTEWVLAETQNAIAQENSAWARVIGSSESEREAFAKGLVDLRKRMVRTLGRTRGRKAVI